ncbi:hypothetical protein [Streptomyces broussonetiae]|uniref:hypothetical protein n=1 Tax=Streptomyces broussonetiae TaxID=2686304 RepID=UPI0018EF1813|nr:hypothetical protein [Streptomyces broussonetiae]
MRLLRGAGHKLRQQPAGTGGGTHDLGFLDGLAAAVNAYVREQQLLTRSDSDFTTSSARA